MNKNTIGFFKSKIKELSSNMSYDYGFLTIKRSGNRISLIYCGNMGETKESVNESLREFFGTSVANLSNIKS